MLVRLVHNYFIFLQDVRKTDITKNETVVGEHLKFERKDVWDMKWADVSCIVGSLNKSFRASHNSVSIQRRRRSVNLKLMLHGTIRNHDFQGNTALQCWNNVVTIRNNIATILQRCVALKMGVANRLLLHHLNRTSITHVPPLKNAGKLF